MNDSETIILTEEEPVEPPASFTHLLPIAGMLLTGQIVLIAVLYLLCRALAKTKVRPDNILRMAAPPSDTDSKN